MYGNQDIQTSGRYRQPFHAIPSDFFATQYYDHLRQITCPGENTSQYVEFPFMTENGIIIKWGFSIFDVAAGVPREISYTALNQFRISLMVNRNAVPGYSGIGHCINTEWEFFAAPAVINHSSASVFAYDKLVNLNIPIKDAQTPLGVDFFNLTLDRQTTEIYARIVGIYSAP